MPASHHSPSPSPPPSKRQKTDTESTPSLRPRVNFRDAVTLAPMVRSGTLPSRLLALKYGADLVWHPETVDKAIIGCERVVNESTGVISYTRGGRALFTMHPIERNHLIFQLGSADPELAVKAALTVLPDVAGIDLNCGCPKSFSVHSGMGAALLTNPDLLCGILTALREALPSDVPVTAKIRLLPTQDDTLKLVKRIVETGVSALTVHCRTRNMRPREPALIHRLREVVEFVEGLGVGVTVLENGDCSGRPDAKRVRDTTGAHGVMIARAAESNLSCFSTDPIVDATSVLALEYLRLAKYLDNAWGNSKFCVSQFSSPSPASAPGGKSYLKHFRSLLTSAKEYDVFENEFEGGLAGGEGIMDEIRNVMEARNASGGAENDGSIPAIKPEEDAVAGEGSARVALVDGIIAATNEHARTATPASATGEFELGAPTVNPIAPDFRGETHDKSGDLPLIIRSFEQNQAETPGFRSR
ncbi:hypothetical protein BOTBODRAFT_169084 [Botryobasidium botryosum FD-172 SS1]|uniref:DUS-like FMN-binding domain-containing protein n=1 Tax=Botryobasidium botryosum (strain FD-172 SS1) TaxID=930990 RepID=A0A067N239_BOTB1|nr:hypothetical protein BOTBODRAFT_169084 [Botryobasidium botryosum FD-172 SS1]